MLAFGWFDALLDMTCIGCIGQIYIPLPFIHDWGPLVRSSVLSKYGRFFYLGNIVWTTLYTIDDKEILNLDLDDWSAQHWLITSMMMVMMMVMIMVMMIMNDWAAEHWLAREPAELTCSLRRSSSPARPRPPELTRRLFLIFLKYLSHISHYKTLFLSLFPCTTIWTTQSPLSHISHNIFLIFSHFFLFLPPHTHF